MAPQRYNDFLQVLLANLPYEIPYELGELIVEYVDPCCVGTYPYRGHYWVGPVFAPRGHAWKCYFCYDMRPIPRPIS